MFHVLFLILVLIFYVQHRTKQISFKCITSKIPTKYGLPFIGIGYQFLPIKKFLYVLGENFKELKSSTYFTWLGANPFIITIDPDIVKTILTSEEFLNKSRSFYSSVDYALPNGVMTSKGKKWKHNRRLLNFSFSHKILKDLMTVFNKSGSKAVNKLNTLVDDKEHDIFVLIKRLMFQTSIETTMGVQLKTGDRTDEKLARGFNFMLQEVAKEMIYNSVCLGFLTRTKKYYKTIKFLREFAANLIKQNYADKAVSKSKSVEENAEAEHEIFIKQAISYHEKGLFSLDDVISESHTMIAGTFDTVSTSIFSLIVLLAMHDDVQEKLFTEVKQLFTKNEDIDYELIKKLPYTDMVIDEALRLMPSIPVIARETIQNFQITKDILVPKGMQVIIPIFTLHRCKSIWGANADAFDPENFSADKVKARHPFSYIPFSKGMRNCLGTRYAHVALRVLLIKLVRNFKFSTTFKYKDLIFLDYISLRYDKEPKIKIEKRLN